MRRAIVVLSLLMVLYNGPYLWIVEYGKMQQAVSSPTSEDLNTHHFHSTEQSFTPICFKKIACELGDWRETRGKVPVGELACQDPNVSCLISWKVKRTLDEITSQGTLSGLLYHPGILEKLSLPELGRDYPAVILRVGTQEQLEEFAKARKRVRIYTVVIWSVFLLGGILVKYRPDLAKSLD